MTTQTRFLPTGWMVFAGTVLFMVGAFNVIWGIALLADPERIAFTEEGLLLFNLTAWGWILLVFGIVKILTSIGIFMGQFWARVVGIIVATFNAIAMLGVLSVNPAWALLVIAVDVFIIYGLTVHGELEEYAA